MTRGGQGSVFGGRVADRISEPLTKKGKCGSPVDLISFRKTETLRNRVSDKRSSRLGGKRGENKLLFLGSGTHLEGPQFSSRAKTGELCIFTVRGQEGGM